ncbi:hypothetical protein [Streptomyces longispororuber]|uniref:hypothetical protein n=1 Tax=Streptomyces longispororuber TaxID=68230 RepID=UPI00210EB0A0|nr:hypothetical protein [Streptomyces longispororuber]MCQ4214154.1 hypothetical protein [Streptomyces longispororuber]
MQFLLADTRRVVRKSAAGCQAGGADVRLGDGVGVGRREEHVAEDRRGDGGRAHGEQRLSAAGRRSRSCATTVGGPGAGAVG